jgi:hypothetical protein
MVYKNTRIIQYTSGRARQSLPDGPLVTILQTAISERSLMHQSLAAAGNHLNLLFA